MMVNRASGLFVSLVIFSLFLNATLIGLAGLTSPVFASPPNPSGIYFDHLVVIMVENEGVGNICGGNPPPCNGANTPYMSSLANSYGIGQQYLALINTSWPNYYGITGASIFGCPTDCYPAPGSVTATNLVDRFEAAGVTWKGYFENQGLAAGCVTTDHEPYTYIHNPFILFQDVTSNSARCNNLVLANPSGCTVTDCTLINDLNSGAAPNFMWLTPSDCDNMRGNSVCTNGCTVDGSTTCLNDGDNYFKSLVPNILSSAAFKNGRSALFITFDEGTGYCPLNNSSENCVYAVWAGPLAKTGYSTPNKYDHYSLTKTIETNWNLASLTSNDAGATAMSEFFSTTRQNPDFSITASPTNISSVTGSKTSSTISVSSLGGFSGTVTLSTAVSPTGPTATLSATSVNLSPGGSATSTLSFQSSTAGNYTVTVNGTSGSLTHSVPVQANVKNAPNFLISLNPSFLGMVPGATQSSTITLTSLNGFTGQVSLSATVSAGGFGVKISPNNPTLASGGSTTSTMAITSPNNAVIDNYNVTLTGKGGSVTNTITITLAITGFALAINPGDQSFHTGSSATFNVTLASLNGFSGNVTLTDSVSNNNLVAVLSSTIINVPASGTVVTPLRVSSSANGGYSVTVTGTFSNVVKKVSAAVDVTAGSDFVLSASPIFLTVTLGSSGSSTITATSLNGLTGTMNYKISVNPAGPLVTLSPTSNKIAPGSQSTTTLAISIPSSTHVGLYSLVVTGQSGPTHTVTVWLYVSRHPSPDFILSANPTSVSFNSGSSSTFSVIVTPTNGFTGTVNLSTSTSPSTGLNVGCVPTSISGGSGSSTCTLNSSTSGNYTAIVTGTSGSLSHSATVSVSVIQPLVPDYTISASPTSVSADTGNTGTSTISITPVNGFNSTIVLSTTTNSTNLDCSVSPNTIPGGSGTSLLSCTGSTAANYLVTVTGTSGSLAHSASVTFRVQDFSISANPASVSTNINSSGTANITIAPINGFTGTISLAVTTNSTNLSCNLGSTSISGGSGFTSLSCTGSQAGNYQAAVTGSIGSLSHSASVVYQVTNAPTFSLSTNPATVSSNAGSTGTSTITVTPQNGFTGVVTLSVVTNSSGLSCSLSSSIIVGSGSSTLSCTGSTWGNYLASVTGTSSGIATPPPATVTYIEQDFGISASPTSLTQTVGSLGSSIITINALNGFTGTVTLVFNTNSTRLSCSLTSTTVSGGSGSSTLSCNSFSSGNYSANVTGTSGALAHSIIVTYHVTAAPDFSISSSPGSLTLVQGSSGSSTITLTSLNSFSGTVTLTASVSPTGPSASLAPASVILTSNGAGGSTLTVNSASSSAATYTVTVTGTSGSLSHSVLITVTITPSTTSGSYALVVSYEGYVYKLYTNNSFVRIGQPVTTQLREVAWKPDGTYALIVGDSGVLIKYDGSNLTIISTGTTANLLSVAWKPDGSYALIGGYTGVLLRYDGTTVTQITNPYAGAYYRAISWNPSGTQALMVSYSGGIYTYAASTAQVTQLASPTTKDLGAVAWNPSGSYALIAGSGGVVLRYDGTSFQVLNTAGVYNSSLTVRYVSFNPSGSLALLVGDSGLVLTYDGTSLSTLPVMTSSILYSVSWNNGTAYLVGGMGVILTYSGGTLSSIPSGFNSGYRGIAWKPN